MLMVFAVIFALIILGQIFFFKNRGKQQAGPAQNQTAQSNKPTPEAASAPAQASPNPSAAFRGRGA